jgi:hypothetical protein
VHEYSGRFISPVPVFTTVTDSQNDPQSLVPVSEYLTTFSIDGQWYLLWSGTGSPNHPGTNCRVLTISQMTGNVEESAMVFTSISGLSSSASKKAE